MIEAGKLDRRLALLAPVTIVDESGEERSSWETLATVFAERRSLNLRDINRGAGTGTAVEAKFIIRYRGGLDTTMRVRCDGQEFEVVAVELLGRREGLELLARAV